MPIPMQRSAKRTEINAVHADEVGAFLDRVGLADAFDRGEVRCAICGAGLDEAGIGAARSQDGSIVFACSRLDCIREFS